MLAFPAGLRIYLAVEAQDRTPDAPLQTSQIPPFRGFGIGAIQYLPRYGLCSLSTISPCKPTMPRHSILNTMHWLRAGIPLLFAGLCFAADSAPLLAQSPCSDPSTSSACGVPVAPVAAPSLKDLKSAQQAFKRGLKLEKSQNFDRAFNEFERRPPRPHERRIPRRP